MLHTSQKTQRLQFLVAALCVTFLVFFRARWAFEVGPFDENCYYEWLHKLVGAPYPACYLRTHLPGTALLWVPAAGLAFLLEKISGMPFESWLLPLTALSSFLAWGLSLLLLDRIFCQFFREGFGPLFGGVAWTVLLVLNIPILDFVGEHPLMSHAAELLAATLTLYFVLSNRFLVALLFCAWLISIRLNDAPMLLVVFGRYLDVRGVSPIDRKNRLFIGSSLLVLAALGGAVYWIGFKSGHGGFRLTDILLGAKIETLSMLLFTPAESLLLFIPLWCGVFVFGAFSFRYLSWMSRGGWIWMLSLLVFYTAHRSVWTMDGPHFRFFIASYLSVFTILADLQRAGKLNKALFQTLVVYGAVWYTAFRWAASPTSLWIQMITGTYENSRFIAHDGTSTPLLVRKWILEPIGLSAPVFAAFSWAQSTRFFAKLASFRVYTLRPGPALWILTLASSLTFGYLVWWLRIQVKIFSLTRGLSRNRLTSLPTSNGRRAFGSRKRVST